jgi:hypothetical protein
MNRTLFVVMRGNRSWFFELIPSIKQGERRLSSRRSALWLGESRGRKPRVDGHALVERMTQIYESPFLVDRSSLQQKKGCRPLGHHADSLLTVPVLEGVVASSIALPKAGLACGFAFLGPGNLQLGQDKLCLVVVTIPRPLMGQKGNYAGRRKPG